MSGNGAGWKRADLHETTANQMGQFEVDHVPYGTELLTRYTKLLRLMQDLRMRKTAVVTKLALSTTLSWAHVVVLLCLLGGNVCVQGCLLVLFARVGGLGMLVHMLVSGSATNDVRACIVPETFCT